MRGIATHVLVELYNCDSERLDDAALLAEALLEAARLCGATILDHRFHRFSPHGVSGVVLVAESHLALHTWPEHGYAAVDIFSCAPRLDFDAGVAHLERALGARSVERVAIPRGQRALTREPR